MKAQEGRAWGKLSAGGQEVQCGWLKDRFGVSWQVVPTVLVEMLQDKDPARAKRVMTAMLKMKKAANPASVLSASFAVTDWIRTLTVALLRPAVGMIAITSAGIFQSG